MRGNLKKKNGAGESSFKRGGVPRGPSLVEANAPKERSGSDFPQIPVRFVPFSVENFDVNSKLFDLIKVRRFPVDLLRDQLLPSDVRLKEADRGGSLRSIGENRK